MQPRDPDDLRFAARLVMDGYLDRDSVEKVLESQKSLIAKGRSLTIPQICLKKKWLTRAEIRFLLGEDRPPADLVDGWEIEGLLGTGGMSRVFKARPQTAASPNSRRPESGPCALKVLMPHLSRQKMARERFEREADRLIQFDHENIVKGYEFFEADGLVVLAMEQVPGIELLQLLDEHGAFQEDAALYVVLQIARGLRHMQEQGIVHRDIKPGNVLITRDNTVKICDLGLAVKEKGEDGDLDGGVTAGTVAYISPEQARGETDLDVRSDIYSLGVTLYQLVVGELPFEGDDDYETMAKRFQEALSSPKLARVSPHVHYFIQKMMAMEKAMRYQSPGELIEDIEESIRGKKSLTVNALTAGESSLDLEKPFEESKTSANVPRSRPRRSSIRRKRR